MLAYCLADSSAFAASLLRDGVAIPDAARLPTVEVAIALSDRDRRYRATGALGFTNRTGGPLATIPLVVAANDQGAAPVQLDALTVVSGGSGRFDRSDPGRPLLTLDRPLEDGEALSIGFTVSGELRALPPGADDPFGSMEAGDDGLFATGDGISVVSGAFPRVAPFVDGAPAPHPAWSGPASFRVTVTTPKGLDVVTNLLDGPARVRHGEQTLVAEGVGPSDVVLVAARDWVVQDRQVGDVTVRSWSRARDRVGGFSVVEVGARAVRFLERYGAYPYRELDLVEASLVGGVGGVEYGGLALIGGSLYRDQAQPPLLALAPQLGSAPAMQLGEQRDFVVAHEVAHQWSPGLVGADAWNHLIVDEPLAQYLAWRVCSDEQHPAEARVMAGRQITANYALMRLLGGEDQPADQPGGAYRSPLAYAGLVYGKAPGLYFALEGAVGRGALDEALRRAFAERAWTTTGPDGWLESLERGGAGGAVALGRRWWDEAHGDEDLGLDPSGRNALRLLLGPELAERFERLCGPEPGRCLRAMLGGGP